MSLCLLQAFQVELRNPHRIFIWPTGIDCSNSVNHDQAQVFSFSKYSFCYSYLLLGLNLQPLDNFTQKHFPTKCFIHYWGEIEKSGMVDHTWTEKGNHLPWWYQAKIIDSEEHWKIRLLKEVVYM